MMSIDPLSGTYMNRNEARRLSLEIRDCFSDHYSAKPHEQELILDYALALKPGDVIVELGVCNGQTAAMLARSTTFTQAFYYGVDFFGLENTYAELTEKFDDLSLPGMIVEGKTQDVGRTWTKYVNRTEYDGYEGISLLFIDAGHDEANVSEDIRIWLPLVKPGGMVIFHDYDDPYNQNSPHWAVRHYADLATIPTWERFIIGSMLVATKPTTKKLTFTTTEE